VDGRDLDEEQQQEEQGLRRGGGGVGGEFKEGRGQRRRGVSGGARTDGEGRECKRCRVRGDKSSEQEIVVGAAGRRKSRCLHHVGYEAV
jgi:hypothetical protein